jgi:hypothetical protein
MLQVVSFPYEFARRVLLESLNVGNFLELKQKVQVANRQADFFNPTIAVNINPK